MSYRNLVIASKAKQPIFDGIEIAMAIFNGLVMTFRANPELRQVTHKAI